MFPPVPPSMIERGYADFAERWNPILDVFDEVGVRFAHEVHPSEIAYDYWTTQHAMEAIGHRPASASTSTRATSSGRTSTPSASCGTSATASTTSTARSRSSSSTAATAGCRRTCRGATRAAGWDFVSTGHGDVPWEAVFRMLNSIGYSGPISVEWEDAGHGPDVGAPDALAFVRRLTQIEPPEAAFDAAFSSNG